MLRVNSAGGGVRAQVTRYVEVDFEGLADSTVSQTAATSPGTGVSPLYGWRILLAGVDKVLTHAA